MSKKIYIIGAGAIGSLVGGYLTKKLGKENIVLVDIDEEHIKNIRDEGLKIFDKGQKNPQLQKLQIIDVNIITPDKIDRENLEKVILSTKSYSNEEALKGLREKTEILVLQNGYDERLNEFSNSVRGIEFGFACQVKEPGFIYNAVKGKYVLGSLNEVSERVWEWADILEKSGIRTELTNNLQGYLWSKLLINSALNPVSAIKRYSFSEIIENKESRELFKDLYREGYPIVEKRAEEVGEKLGNFIGPPELVNSLFKHPNLSDFVLKLVAKKFGEVESTMLQDVRKQRQTEIDYINKQIINLGKKYNIATPINNWIYNEVKKIEQEIKKAN